MVNYAELVRSNLENVIDQERIHSLFKLEQTGEQQWKITESPEIPCFKGATYYQGKVRANFFGGRLFAGDVPLRIIVATDQVSTHDIIRGTIPFKGQILLGIHSEMLSMFSGSLKHSDIYKAGANVMFVENCDSVDVEMVLRKYMAKSSTTTSLYYHYVNLGKRDFCGHKLPEGLVANDPLPYIMDTPSTRGSGGEEGHDESVSPEELYARQLVTPEQYQHLRNATLEDFVIIYNLLICRGIIVPDTKFELGRSIKGELVLIDEVFTPDSSRFWSAKDYEEKMRAGQDPTSYSKEIVRAMGDKPEPLTDEQRVEAGKRYCETYELLMGKPFEPAITDYPDNPIMQIVCDINSGFSYVHKAVGPIRGTF